MRENAQTLTNSANELEMSLIDELSELENLDQLCERLNLIWELQGWNKRNGVDDYYPRLDNLPVYSDNEPDDTVEIWSWDDERLLVNAEDVSEDDFKIVSIAEWNE